MKDFLLKIQSAFDTHSKGFSARKLTAFAIVTCVFAAHIAWLKKAFLQNDFSLLSEILIIDYGFISTLLGMTTYEAIKRGNNDTKPEQS